MSNQEPRRSLERRVYSDSWLTRAWVCRTQLLCPHSHSLPPRWSFLHLPPACESHLFLILMWICWFADIYAENSWLFCPFWSKMLRSFPFQPSRVERPGLFLLGAWNPFLPWKMWVFDAHLCCLLLPLQNILLWLGWSTVLLSKKKILY